MNAFSRKDQLMNHPNISQTDSTREWVLERIHVL